MAHRRFDRRSWQPRAWSWQPSARPRTARACLLRPSPAQQIASAMPCTCTRNTLKHRPSDAMQCSCCVCTARPVAERHLDLCILEHRTCCYTFGVRREAGSALHNGHSVPVEGCVLGRQRLALRRLHERVAQHLELCQQPCSHADMVFGASTMSYKCMLLQGAETTCALRCSNGIGRHTKTALQLQDAQEDSGDTLPATLDTKLSSGKQKISL